MREGSISNIRPVRDVVDRSRLARRVLLAEDRHHLWIVATAALVWTVVMGRLAILRHDAFATFDFDLGLNDQAIWLLSRGESFNTVRGMHVLGHHATFAYYLLVPLVWLGAGAHVWNVLNCAAMASCAIPIYVLARRRLPSPVWATTVALAWLLQPWLSWFAWETFHPEVMAMPFLFLGYALVDPRWHRDATHLDRTDLAALVAFALAMAWKEDIALAVMMLGVVVVLLGRRRMGAIMALGGLVWFVVFGAWMVSAINGGAVVYGGLYGDLGSSSLDVAMNAVLQPRLTLDRLGDNHALLYAVRLLAPMAFLAVGAPVVLLMTLPQVMANILSTADFTFQPIYHYQAVPMVAVALGSLETLYRLRRWKGTTSPRRAQSFAVVVLLVVSLLGARGWGITPLGVDYERGPWPLGGVPTDGWRAAVARVGPDAGVAAHHRAVPHLAHRRIVYTFPNPWVNSYYGTSPEQLGDAAAVDWLIVLETDLNDAARAALETLLARGEFGDRQEVDGVTTYRRLRPPG